MIVAWQYQCTQSHSTLLRFGHVDTWKFVWTFLTTQRCHPYNQVYHKRCHFSLISYWIKLNHCRRIWKGFASAFRVSGTMGLFYGSCEPTTPYIKCHSPLEWCICAHMVALPSPPIEYVLSNFHAWSKLSGQNAKKSTKSCHLIIVYCSRHLCPCTMLVGELINP